YISRTVALCFFLLTDPPTTEIYTLSLHDALPIWFGSRIALISSPFASSAVAGASTLMPGACMNHASGFCEWNGPPEKPPPVGGRDRKSTRLNSSHVAISYAVFCLKKKNKR